MQAEQRTDAPEQGTNEQPLAVDPAAVGLRGLGDRIEVAWEVKLDDGSEGTVWWGAELGQKAADGDENNSVWTLKYNAAHGCEEEEREVTFASENSLWDVELAESLPWRPRNAKRPREEEQIEQASNDDVESNSANETDEEIGVFAPGTWVKMHLDGDRPAISGVVATCNEDGTLDLQCDDQTLVQNVPREHVQHVEMSKTVAAALEREEEGCVDGVEMFFSTFVRALMGGAMFAKLTQEQQRVASEKVQQLRPHFEKELQLLREERGCGAVVTAEDIQLMLPRVMARSKAN